VILTATLQGFGHAFDAAIAKYLPVMQSNKERLDFSDPDDFKEYKVVQANNNAMEWLRMAFPLPSISMYRIGVAHEVIRCLKARVIPAREVAATVLQAEFKRPSGNRQQIQ
jgi:hypothetical protein